MGLALDPLQNVVSVQWGLDDLFVSVNLEVSDAIAGLPTTRRISKASGDVVWAASPGNGPNTSAAVAVDKSSNVIVAGRNQQTFNAPGFLLAKFDRSGADQWGAFLWDPGSSEDVSRAFIAAVDLDKNVFTFTNRHFSPENNNYQKLSPEGGLIWESPIADAAAGLPVSAKCDHDGHLWVTNRQAGGSSAHLRRYHGTTGAELLRIDLPTPSATAAPYEGALAVDDDDNIYVGMWDPLDLGFGVAIKYSSAGALIWSLSTLPVTGIDVAADGVAIGLMDDTGGIIAKYNLAATELLWSVVLPRYASIAVARSGEVFAVADRYTLAHDLVDDCRKYSVDGDFVWSVSAGWPADTTNIRAARAFK